MVCQGFKFADFFEKLLYRVSLLQLCIAIVCDCYIEIVKIDMIAFFAGRVVRGVPPVGIIGG